MRLRNLALGDERLGGTPKAEQQEKTREKLDVITIKSADASRADPHTAGEHRTGVHPPGTWGPGTQLGTHWDSCRLDMKMRN